MPNNEERLPVILISKREKDLLSTEGGGGDDPKWILKPYDTEDRKLLKYKSELLNNQLDVINDYFTNFSEKRNLPTIARVRMNEKAIAKSYRPHIKSIVDKASTGAIIGVADEDLLIVIKSRDQIATIKQKLVDIDNYFYGISCIDELSLNYTTFLESPEQEYKVKLVNLGNKFGNDHLNTFVTSVFSSNKITLLRREYGNELIIYRVSANNVEIQAVLEEVENLLISIEPMPKISLSFDKVTVSKSLEIKVPEIGIEYPVVGVLDSGINDNRYLSPWIIDRHSQYIDSDLDKSHGTFVAGLINYGDELLGHTLSETSPCFIYDAAVLPDLSRFTVYEDELIDNIKEAVERRQDIKIWNMSLGTKNECQLNSFSDFAIALDALQDEFDILIIKSAGNSSHGVTRRISNSADSIRALTVGSITQEDGMVPKDYLSPFSRIGRGPCSIIKPEVVHYGGNLSASGSILGVSSLDTDGEIIQNAGTSFSTPRISGIASTLHNVIDEKFDPLLIKALIIHNSSYPIHSDDQDYKVKAFGFGKPSNIDQMLHNSQNDVTLILRDTLEKGNYIDVFDFPVPDCLISEEGITGQIIVTLVYSQKLSASQGSEYCQSDIDVKMGTYENIKARDVERNNLLKNPFGRDNSVNVLLKGKYSKPSMRQNLTPFSLFERNLIDFNGKYYPVKKYTVDLSDLTQANILSLQKSKKWFIQVKGVYRNDVEVQAKEDGEILSQDFCVIISIRDPNQKLNIYDETLKLINSENFWHSSLKIRNNISINV